jgi:hypothetical protein
MLGQVRSTAARLLAYVRVCPVSFAHRSEPWKIGSGHCPPCRVATAGGAMEPLGAVQGGLAGQLSRSPLCRNGY